MHTPITNRNTADTRSRSWINPATGVNRGLAIPHACPLISKNQIIQGDNTDLFTSTPQIIAVSTEMTTRTIPRPKPEIAIKSQSRITNPPAIATDRDFLRRWGSRCCEEDWKAVGEKCMRPV